MSLNTSGISTGTEAAERVADILLTFVKGDDSMGVSAIARELRLSKAVVHRVLQSLVSRGLIQFNQGTRDYSLGPGSAAIGARAMRKLNIREVARHELVQLRNVTHETTTLSLLVVDKRIYVDQYESPLEIKMTVELGRFYPLYAGASSRSILAHLPPADVARVIDAGLAPLTHETLHDRVELMASLEEIRERGYATSRGERQDGAGSVAAPIFDIGGQVMGSISVCGPLARFDPESVNRYIPLVCKTSAHISKQLANQ